MLVLSPRAPIDENIKLGSAWLMPKHGAVASTEINLRIGNL
jgi:hypothetical protein